MQGECVLSLFSVVQLWRLFLLLMYAFCSVLQRRWMVFGGRFCDACDSNLEVSDVINTFVKY